MSETDSISAADFAPEEVKLVESLIYCRREHENKCTLDWSIPEHRATTNALQWLLSAYRDQKSRCELFRKQFGVALIICPDCGEVDVIGEIWEHGKPIGGKCPKCREFLYFGE